MCVDTVSCVGGTVSLRDVLRGRQERGTTMEKTATANTSHAAGGDPMTARTYVARFVEELDLHTPDDVKVSDAGGGLVVIERGDASVPVWLPRAVDRRRTVNLRDVRDTLARAADKLAREIPHYVPRFVEPSRELVEILRRAESVR